MYRHQKLIQSSLFCIETYKLLFWFQKFHRSNNNTTKSGNYLFNLHYFALSQMITVVLMLAIYFEIYE